MKNLLLFCLMLISFHTFSQELLSETKFTEYMNEKVSKSNEKLTVITFDKLVLASKFNNASYFHNLKGDYPKYTSKKKSLDNHLLSYESRMHY